jgi:hypothetical protein
MALAAIARVKDPDPVALGQRLRLSLVAPFSDGDHHAISDFVDVTPDQTARRLFVHGSPCDTVRLAIKTPAPTIESLVNARTAETVPPANGGSPG